MKNSLSRLRNLDKMCRMLMKDIGDAYAIPGDLKGKQLLLRGLMNMRYPITMNPDFLELQDKELQLQRQEKGEVSVDSLVKDSKLYIWQGDITRLQIDVIVNAANNQMLGCFQPLHACIDNAIHSAAGIQLRDACNKLMNEQGHPEETGQAKITPGFNLPARYVIHTVGPIIPDAIPTDEQCEQLASCYRSCLQLAEEKGYESFVVPGDIGGRYSVLTPVGLLPIAAAGGDVRSSPRSASPVRRSPPRRGRSRGCRAVANRPSRHACRG